MGIDLSVFPQFLTTQEVAEILRIDESTVCRWAKDGWMNAIALGKGKHKMYRFPRATLEQTIQIPSQPSQLLEP